MKKRLENRMKNSMKKLIARFLVFVCVICSAFMTQMPATVNAAETTMLNTYGAKYGRSGTCINLYQLRDQNTLNVLKKHYNSITLENEMKPDALLGGSAKLISVNEAKNLGYYIPSNYKESTVPKINFNSVDEAMKICYENGLGMRAHTLVWHSQTPTWFFRNGYTSYNGFVNASTMDARMEMYIKTVMNHVYTNKYGSCVYTWDVVNEYLHAQNSGWEAVYGKCGNRPGFVKKAYQYAYDTISYFKLNGKVTLMFNDFNTYMETNNEIAVVNYINEGKKICDGIGMQSHLGTNFPTPASYESTVKAFLNAGLEVQITEMDITNKSDTDLGNYVYDLYKRINTLKKNGAKITGVTWWGISDQVTWIKDASPLLFSTPYQTKGAYNRYMQAFNEVFGAAQPNPQPANPQPANPQPVNPKPAAQVKDGWYYLKNVNAQKYLQVAGNTGKAGQNVELGKGTGVKGQKWYVQNVGNGYITLKSGLGNFMLDVASAKNQDGTNIMIYNAHSGTAQQFVPQVTANKNVYVLATKASNLTKALDDYNFSKADGANVCQWTNYGAANQQWVFEPAQ